MKKRIVKITGLTAAVIVISLILCIFVSAQSIYNIQNLSGYNVTFKDTLTDNIIPSEENVIEWKLYFTANNKNYCRIRIHLTLHSLTYGYVDNESETGISYDVAKPGSNLSWVSNMKSIKISGGPDAENSDLLYFINVNAANASVNIPTTTDPYENMFEYIDNNLSVMSTIKNNFDNLKDDYINGISVIGNLAYPAKQLYNEIGVAIALGMAMVISLAFVKRTNIDRVNNHTSAPTDETLRKAESNYNDYYKDYMKHVNGKYN